MALLSPWPRWTWVALVGLLLTACQCRPATPGAQDAAVVDAGHAELTPMQAEESPGEPEWRAVAAAVERGDEASLDDVTGLLRSAGVDTGEPPLFGPNWDCTSDAVGWWCTRELLGEYGLREAPRPEDDVGDRTVVRAGRWVDGGLVLHEWPEAWVPEVDSSPGGDCMRQCDEGGYPNEGAQADQVGGVGTGACYADCHRMMERRNAGTWSRARTFKFVTRIGARWLVFHWEASWSFTEGEPDRGVLGVDYLSPKADDSLSAEATEPADPPADAPPVDEHPPGSTEAFMVLRIPDSAAPQLEVEYGASSFEGTGPGYVVGLPNGQAVVLAELPDGGVAQGDEACAVLDALDLHRPECGDGGTP